MATMLSLAVPLVVRAAAPAKRTAAAPTARASAPAPLRAAFRAPVLGAALPVARRATVAPRSSVVPKAQAAAAADGEGSFLGISTVTLKKARRARRPERQGALLATCTFRDQP